MDERRERRGEEKDREEREGDGDLWVGLNKSRIVRGKVEGKKRYSDRTQGSLGDQVSKVVARKIFFLTGERGRSTNP